METALNKLFGGRATSTYELGGRSIVLQTLTKAEQVDVLRRETTGLDYMTQAEAVKVPILARSIISIDNTPWEVFADIREELQKDKSIQLVDIVEKKLGELSPGVIEVLYGFYQELIEKDRIRTDELKNSSKGPTQG